MTGCEINDPGAVVAVLFFGVVLLGLWTYVVMSVTNEIRRG